MKDPMIDQFMACEAGNVADEAFHSDLAWRGGVELLDQHRARDLSSRFGGSGMGSGRPASQSGEGHHVHGDQRQPLRRAVALGIDGEPDDLRSARTDLAQFKLVDQTEPPDSPRPWCSPTNCRRSRRGSGRTSRASRSAWLTSEFGGGGSPIANVEFLKQVGCYGRRWSGCAISGFSATAIDAAGEE